MVTNPLHVLRYGKNWFHAAKRLLSVYTEEQARAAHDARELYAVVLGSAEEPEAIVVANQDFWDVSFLDAQLKETLHYQFHENQPGQLFLKSSTQRVEGGAPTIRFFAPDGITQVQTGEKATPGVEQFDVTGNWCPRPAFGDYQELLRKRI